MTDMKKILLIRKINSLVKEVFSSTQEQFAWIHTGNLELDGLSPQELMYKGKYEIIIDFLEDMLLGHMS